jgi:hypothetical protein
VIDHLRPRKFADPDNRRLLKELGWTMLAKLARLPAGPLQHLWTIPLVAAEFDPLHSVSE